MDRKVVLLVEDNADDRDLTLRAFARHNLGNAVELAHDGQDALEYLFAPGPGGDLFESHGGEFMTSCEPVTASAASLEVSPTVLVVDDDRDIRDALCEVLEVEGYAVLHAVDGEEALVSARTHRPALILLDLFMPVMDGVEFRRRQMADPELALIPVVVLSAASGLAQRVAGLDVQAVIEKPMKIETLLEVVARFVRPHPAAD